MRGESKADRARYFSYAVWCGLVLLLGLEFWLHRRIVFMMDDLWYSTNLATGQPLRSFADVLESQKWHFENWGGRNVTHGILQLVLMSGEWAADVMNLCMTLLLGVMICKIAEVKNLFFFLTAEVLLIGFNANVKMSMFWQSGAVNYVYSTVWILFFLWLYLRQLSFPAKEPVPGAVFWILPLGLAAGWSNENIGPACTLAAAVVTLYLGLYKKCRVRLWMIEGVAAAALGSVLVVVAPGNFVRVAAIPPLSPGESIYERVYAMLCATGEFLFPTLAVTGIVILMYLCFCGGRLEPVHWGLLLTALAAHGAMILSPHYPDRATFGIMALCITVIVSLLERIWVKVETARKWIALSAAAVFGYVLFVLSQYLIFAEVIVRGE